MLQYFVQVTFTLFPSLIVLGVVYGFSYHRLPKKCQRVFSRGFFIALLISVIAAALRMYTNAFIREYYNLCCLIVALIAEMVLLVSLGVLLGNRTILAQNRLNDLATGVMTVACFSYVLPDLFLYPFEFAVGLDSIFNAEVLFKVIGYSVGLVLAFAGGLCVSKTVSAITEAVVRKTLLVALFIFSAGQFVHFFQLLRLRSSLMQNETLLTLLLFLLENRNIFTYALLLFMLWISLRCILSNRKMAFFGENPAELRKKRADSKRQIRWSAFGIFSIFIAVLVMTVGAWMVDQTVELSPPVELAANEEKIVVPLETVNDGHLHRFSYTTKNGTQVRYIVIRKSESAYGVALDACDICGASGYYERDGQIVCILCDVVMNIGTIGMPGGCNPVPLDHEIMDGRIIIDVADLEAEAHRFE